MTGGFHLAAEWVWGNELEVVGHCEIDKYCQKVLKERWPNVPIYEDIKKLNGKQFKPVDIITGGFPCQSFSIAGKRKGKEDDRYLWPEMFRVIQEAKPTWVLAENVTGIINMALDTVLSDLESEDYETETFIIPACGVNAPHKRDRVWIVAYSSCKRWRKEREGGDESQKWPPCASSTPFNDTNTEQVGWRKGTHKKMEQEIQGGPYLSNLCKDVADSKRIHIQGFNNGSQQGKFRGESWWTVESDVGRVAHGVPYRVDRLKALGNAIVPQVAYEIFKCIQEVN